MTQAEPLSQIAAGNGVDNVLTGARNASAAQAWGDLDLQERLLGAGKKQSVWRVEELEKFECNKPCMVLRYVHHQDAGRNCLASCVTFSHNSKTRPPP